MSLPNEKITLDDVDRKIMAALREDGRVALAKIAEDPGAFPGMIRMRCARCTRTNTTDRW
ncbi:MAG: AsnC family transcriptional regulator [Chloroflexi bacterium]|nr:AsnC family transcriptional regulator [Chloroflexota bacterium]